tara:strand:- start:3659 stop:4492 length:834 start_codon:yes stop_codon:yes gene_type:complete
MIFADALQKAVKDYGLSVQHARILLGHVIQKTPGHIFAYPEKKVTQSGFDQFIKLCTDLAGGKPITRILGQREFWSLNFQLSDATLDPRPDSETLIEGVLTHIKDKSKDLKILDLGTGTGCLLLSLLHEYKMATGIGVDLNPKAVETATQNAKNLGLNTRATFQQGSWLNGLTEKFDIIISNPPYISHTDYETLDDNVRNFDPKLALVADHNGLSCYEEIIRNAKNYLNPKGILVLEIGFGQKDDVCQILSDNQFTLIECRKDLAGIDRCLTAQPLL